MKWKKKKRSLLNNLKGDAASVVNLGTKLQTARVTSRKDHGTQVREMVEEDLAQGFKGSVTTVASMVTRRRTVGPNKARSRQKRATTKQLKNKKKMK